MYPALLKKTFKYFYPVGSFLFFLFGIFGIIYGLFLSPCDYLHGDLVRILYIHVPCAWFAVLLYACMGGCSIASLVMRSPFYALCAQSLALPGFILTILCIITGSLWGKPAWGTWWVWDARLTSVVVLAAFYLSYLNICNGYDNRAASFLNIIGMVNLPIIKWSVDWWFTLHQPATFSFFKKSCIDPSMQIPLMLISISIAGWVMAIFSKRFFKLQNQFKEKNRYSYE